VPTLAEAGESPLEHLSLEAVGAPRTLHHGPIRHGFAAHEEGDADKTLVAHHGDFRGCPILHDVQEGHDGVGGKIDVIQPAARLVKGLAERQAHLLEMRKKAFELVRG
jgi:hypothetical protein